MVAFRVVGAGEGGKIRSCILGTPGWRTARACKPAARRRSIMTGSDLRTNVSRRTTSRLNNTALGRRQASFRDTQHFCGASYGDLSLNVHVVHYESAYENRPENQEPRASGRCRHLSETYSPLHCSPRPCPCTPPPARLHRIPPPVFCFFRGGLLSFWPP